MNSLRNQYPGEEGSQLYERYVPLMPSHYRARVDTLEALENIQYLELLTHEDNIQFDLKPFTLPSLLVESVSLLYIYSKVKNSFDQDYACLAESGAARD